MFHVKHAKSRAVISAALARGLDKEMGMSVSAKRSTWKAFSGGLFCPVFGDSDGIFDIVAAVPVPAFGVYAGKLHSVNCFVDCIYKNSYVSDYDFLRALLLFILWVVEHFVNQLFALGYVQVLGYDF